MTGSFGPLLYHRLQGTAVLAAVGLLGLGLSLLRQVGRPEAEVTRVMGAEGTILFAIDDRPSMLAWPFQPEVRLVLARTPIGFDPLRSLVHHPGRGSLVAPRGWPTVLVERDGRVRPHQLQVEHVQAVSIIQEALRLGEEEKAFAAVKRRVLEIDRRLEGFWQ